MKKNNRKSCTVKQWKNPIFTSLEILDKNDPVVTFEAIMEEIAIEQYLKPEN